MRIRSGGKSALFKIRRGRRVILVISRAIKCGWCGTHCCGNCANWDVCGKLGPELCSNESPYHGCKLRCTVMGKICKDFWCERCDVGYDIANRTDGPEMWERGWAPPEDAYGDEE